MKKLSSFAVVGVATTAKQVIGPNPRRTALLLSAPATATAVSYAPKTLASLAEGISLGKGASPLDLTLAQHGSIVQDAWWAIAQAQDKISVIEVGTEA